MLADSGYHTILPDQLYAYLTTGAPLPKKPIILTFDDTDLDQFTIANPTLKKYGFKGVYFVMTVSLGRPHYMTADMVKKLSDEGNIIGSHGLVRAMGVGTATITATINPASGTISGSTAVTSTAPAPTSVTVTSADPFIPNGTTQQFTAVLGFTDGTTQDVTSTTTWSSSNQAVATISNAAGSQGLASGVGNGTTTITGTFTGTSGTFSNSATLTVADSVVSGTVIFADGLPVPFPDVFVTQSDSQGNLQTFFTSSTDANGHYWVTDVGLGAFTVIAQDPNSGLNASATGSCARSR